MTTAARTDTPDFTPTIALAIYTPLAAVNTALFSLATLAGHGSLALAASFATVLALPGIIAASMRVQIAPVFAYAAPIAIAMMLLAPLALTGRSAFAAEKPLHITMLVLGVQLIAGAAPAILFRDADPKRGHPSAKAIAVLVATGLVTAAILWPLA